MDRVPTRWFAGILTGAFLLVTAAFGSLQDVPAAALPRVEPETVVEGQQFHIAVDRAVLIDAFPELSLAPKTEGNRLLVILAEVENAFAEPLGTSVSSGLGGNLRVLSDDALVGDSPLEYLRWDDTTRSPWFQPGVPVDVAILWEVDPESIEEGDELSLEIVDRSFRREGLVTYGGLWEAETPLATVEVPVEDVGAGVSGG